MHFTPELILAARRGKQKRRNSFKQKSNIFIHSSLTLNLNLSKLLGGGNYTAIYRSTRLRLGNVWDSFNGFKVFVLHCIDVVGAQESNWQLLFDTFATDQPWDRFALSRYNDWKWLGPRDQLGHLSTFIMKSFGPGQCFHIVSGHSGQFEPRLTLAIEPRSVFVTWPIREKVKISVLLNFVAFALTFDPDVRWRV